MNQRTVFETQVYGKRMKSGDRFKNLVFTGRLDLRGFRKYYIFKYAGLDNYYYLSKKEVAELMNSR